LTISGILVFFRLIPFILRLFYLFKGVVIKKHFNLFNQTVPPMKGKRL